ncbi:HEAT repeat domain-containing protein [Ornithinimicrobium avium]|uniref:HEAT repeat domain-containing protein n=1 Tax=Ornithinimicrobium avium TaxID=2283195 RepID=A0A345NQ12_9MICO|nr:HEAT repeat domain-containing protein [Ornithinimicrobium avium]AXH97120.1 HEAT repeat domain-containing protein [Ornithinimicrobium avium]
MDHHLPAPTDGAHPALSALTHPDKDVRQQGAIALGQLADPRLAPRIADLLWQESDVFVRETLTWVLTRTPAAATKEAAAQLHNPDAEIRLQALHLLSKVADPGSVAVVAQHIDDPDPAVADKARWALARIKDPSVIPLLVDRLGATELTVRDGITATLSQFGAPAVPTVAAALEHQAATVRSHAADVLCFIGAPAAHEATPALTNRLDDDHPDVRLAATLALRELTDHPPARATLHQASINHHDARVRAIARASI